MMLTYDTPMESLLNEILDQDGDGPFGCPICKYDNSEIYENPDNWGSEEHRKVRVLKVETTYPPLAPVRYEYLLEVTCGRCRYKFKMEDASW